MRKTFLSLLLLSILNGCAPSLVYSPSFNLEHKKFEEKEIDLSGGIELLPETRPEETNGQSTLGYQARIRYAFTDKMVLGIKTWGDMEGAFNRFRSGYSLSAQTFWALSERDRIVFIPRIGIAMSDNEVAGYGLNASVLYQYQFHSRLSVYTGAGFIWGFYDLERTFNSEMVSRYPMGYGINANLGIALRLSPKLRVNAELNPIYQLNAFDKVNHFILAPSLNLGYRF